MENAIANYENDEEKLLMEFQKQGFVIRKEENIKYENKNILKK